VPETYRGDPLLPRTDSATEWMNLLQRSFSPGQLSRVGYKISFDLGHFRNGLNDEIRIGDSLSKISVKGYAAKSLIHSLLRCA
jgi:hypothetical protein